MIGVYGYCEACDGQTVGWCSFEGDVSSYSGNNYVDLYLFTCFACGKTTQHEVDGGSQNGACWPTRCPMCNALDHDNKIDDDLSRELTVVSLECECRLSIKKRSDPDKVEVNAVDPSSDEWKERVVALFVKKELA